MEVLEVHVCVECEAKFCDECGAVKTKLCYDCIGWEDSPLDEEVWEEKHLN